MGQSIAQLVSESHIATGQLNALDIGQEGFRETFEGFMDTAKDLINSAVKRVFNTDTVMDIPNPVSTKDLEHDMKDIGFSIIKDINVYGPAKMTGYHSEHVELLAKHFKEYADMENRILKPLIKFMAKIGNNPDELTNVWVDRDLKLVDVEKMKKDLAKTFNPGEIKEGDSTIHKFEDMYSSKKDLYKTGEKLQSMRNNAEIINLDNLMGLEERLVGLIDDVVIAAKNVVINRKTLRKLSEATIAASVELEYLAVMFYYANINVIAYNDTIEKLVEDINAE